jgi:hypothetical protein
MPEGNGIVLGVFVVIVGHVFSVNFPTQSMVPLTTFITILWQSEMAPGVANQLAIWYFTRTYLFIVITVMKFVSQLKTCGLTNVWIIIGAVEGTLVKIPFHSIMETT